MQQRLPGQGKILEIGCGPGSFAENLEGRDLTCLDPIPAMLSVAEPRVNEKRLSRGYSKATFVEGTAESLPFEDCSVKEIFARVSAMLTFCLDLSLAILVANIFVVYAIKYGDISKKIFFTDSLVL